MGVLRLRAAPPGKRDLEVLLHRLATVKPGRASDGSASRARPRVRRYE